MAKNYTAVTTFLRNARCAITIHTRGTTSLCPDSVTFVTGDGPATRRSFFDQLIDSAQPQVHHISYRFHKVLAPITVEFDSFPASSRGAQIADADLGAVGHFARERTACNWTTAVLYVNLVIACRHHMRHVASASRTLQKDYNYFLDQKSALAGRI